MKTDCTLWQSAGVPNLDASTWLNFQFLILTVSVFISWDFKKGSQGHTVFTLGLFCYSLPITKLGDPGHDQASGLTGHYGK